MKAIVISFGLLFGMSTTGFGGALSPEEQRGLEETQKVLTDPVLLLETAAKNAGGSDALQELDKVAGSAENRKLILEFAANVMEQLVIKTEGDADKLDALLKDLKANPKGLEGLLTQKQLQTLGEIGKRIEAKAKLP